ncbi:DUF3060 domain-containing protein [Mycobacterium palustre]|uniref:DUF3060 domain-containing protein n=1 Tax=Mycobacterium palustre TaxID=153971 RepID=A0A1X1ZDS4_9MYCO|nr:DUF3060 domain-containing protein [Mycobacterium palustre]MCV7101847.1 DUF3060 domain-containing protein [Mycobacterium palustre]ORW21425.1 hypothetical protein AWC19_14035 [Mycobacterium palustre]
MDAQDDPEERIRELERPLADTARASELGAPPPPPPPPGPTPSPWTYGGPLSAPAPKPPSGNRIWWILGTFVVVGMIALAGGIAAFAAHQLSGVRSTIGATPTISATFGPPSSTSSSRAPSTTRSKTPKPSASPAPPPGGNVSVSGVNENRTIACNDNVVSVSGVSNTVVITGHCTRLTVSGVQNSITVDSADTIDASGFNNEITYHSGSPKISNPGGSNQVQQG